MAGISSGQLLRVKELTHLGTSLDGKSVRTWGRAVAHNMARSQLKVSDEGIELIIDTSYVEPIAFNRGSLYQFIGEVYVYDNIILRARIATCIDGMNMDLFNQALDIRRKYLKEDLPSVS
ncbi:CST complex subunit TEN1-like [Stylophora pistillata]|uniref:CST complex subunit TEN1 n=1 Tax=Stylophora pistillata TaxID=50429 RepID=A0A2B4SBU6_STYPI|nr:CST complex subunit TEN1-like [Stylophora pistillata]PFX26836.1 CST complex subunit TEN1 [Stylophora pistillata]